MVETITLQFYEGRDGRPVSRLENGKVVLPDKFSALQPRAGEWWEGQISERERFAIFTPSRKIERWERVETSLYLFPEPRLVIRDVVYDEQEERTVPPEELTVKWNCEFNREELTVRTVITATHKKTGAMAEMHFIVPRDEQEQKQELGWLYSHPETQRMLQWLSEKRAVIDKEREKQRKQKKQEIQRLEQEIKRLQELQAKTEIKVIAEGTVTKETTLVEREGWRGSDSVTAYKISEHRKIATDIDNIENSDNAVMAEITVEFNGEKVKETVIARDMQVIQEYAEKKAREIKERTVKAVKHKIFNIKMEIGEVEDD